MDTVATLRTVDYDKEIRELVDHLLGSKDLEATLLYSSALIGLIRDRADEMQRARRQPPPAMAAGKS